MSRQEEWVVGWSGPGSVATRVRATARACMESEACVPNPSGRGEAVAIKAAAPSVRAMAAPARIQSRAAG